MTLVRVLKTDNTDELVRIQAGTAHQRPVHVTLGHDPGGVISLDGSAVQDPDLVRDGAVVELGQPTRIAAQTSCASSGVATSPVPIAQTGS